MTDIIIYTNQDALNHKKGLQKGEEEFTHFYWDLNKMPKKLENSERIYFACDGLIQGYFIIEDVDDSDGCIIEWNKDSWVELDKKIPTKPFQGFKYADKVEGLVV